MSKRALSVPAPTAAEGSFRNRGRCKLRFGDSFWAAVEGLEGLGADGARRRASAGATVRAFFEAWIRRTAASDHELSKGRWKYKQLQGKRAKAAKLRQIYLSTEQGGLRAALVVEEGERCVVWALLAYHKRNQDAEIERAAAIALEQRGGQP